MATILENPQEAIDWLVKHVGTTLRVATPLGAGKPNHLLNALYQRAKADPQIDLTLFTALTLQRPRGKSLLESRFLGPFEKRVFGNYPDLDYELDRVAGKLPSNVRVMEFYFAPAKYKNNAAVQRDYISSNYTHAARDVMDRGVNVLFQQVAKGEVDGETMYSLSCNPDLSVDVMNYLESVDEPVAVMCQTNDELPFMYGDAVVKPSRLSVVVENPQQNYTVFGPPKLSVSETEYAIGLSVSALVKDGGELQVGIGALGDAVVYGLILRHEQNSDYRKVLEALQVQERLPEKAKALGGTAPFEKGLFAASEMLIDGFLELFRRGIIKRRVYDDLHLQRLLNKDRISEDVTEDTLDALLEERAIHSVLTKRDVKYLVHFGVFAPGVSFDDGHVVTPSGERVEANLLDPSARKKIVASCLGQSLQHGAVMHGGFFLGTQDFYRGLRELTEEHRQLIRMRSVTRINQLYGHEDIDRLHRRDARFVNTCMMVTLSGAAVSDGLEDGTVITGVGGQYKFVEMAQALPDGHSVLCVRSTRQSGGKLSSNIVFNYGHVTVPRHMRDIYVSEYGVARVRGCTDEEIIMQLLNITDSRFQDELMGKAKSVGKLRADYQIPEIYRHNTPERIATAIAPFKKTGLFPAFPLGCDLTDEERVIGKALKHLKAHTATTKDKLKTIGRALTTTSVPRYLPYLKRMELDAPKTSEERLYRKLLIWGLKETGAP